MNSQSEQINELASALAKAQGALSKAEKDRSNPFFKSKYATLDSIWDAIRAPLSNNGLAIIQTISSQEDQIFLTTTLAHSSGQWMRSEVPVVSGKFTPQVLGSAMTYMRRYALASIVGATSGEDDDGEIAQRRHQEIRNEVVTNEEFNKIESYFSEEDGEYKQKLLNYYSDKCKKSLADFSQLPREYFDSILNAFEKRKKNQREKITSIGGE